MANRETKTKWHENLGIRIEGLTAGNPFNINYGAYSAIPDK